MRERGPVEFFAVPGCGRVLAVGGDDAREEPPGSTSLSRPDEFFLGGLEPGRPETGRGNAGNRREDRGLVLAMIAFAPRLPHTPTCPAPSPSGVPIRTRPRDVSIHCALPPSPRSVALFVSMPPSFSPAPTPLLRRTSLRFRSLPTAPHSALPTGERPRSVLPVATRHGHPGIHHQHLFSRQTYALKCGASNLVENIAFRTPQIRPRTLRQSKPGCLTTRESSWREGRGERDAVRWRGGGRGAARSRPGDDRPSPGATPGGAVADETRGARARPHVWLGALEGVVARPFARPRGR